MKPVETKERSGGALTIAAALALGALLFTSGRLRATHGAGWLRDSLPESLSGGQLFGLATWQWFGLVAAGVSAWLAGRVFARGALALVRQVSRRTTVRWDDEVVLAADAPLQLFAVFAAFGLMVEPLLVPERTQAILDGLRRPALIGAAAWLLVRVFGAIARSLEGALGAGGDELASRGSRTQVRVIHRLISAGVVVVAAALVLTEFEIVRKVGVSLLASAGIAGVVLGFAAQRSIATLLAGVQLTLTQPVRIGDTVIVEGEWGNIEEIHLTYIVVKIWDLRRLVVPITYFLERPFQNWTKVSPDTMGTVELHADPSTPVPLVRAELERRCKADPNWDGKVCGLQVTGANERTIVLRALVSSADASKNWDLRCSMREGLIDYLQQLEGGRYLPRVRLESSPASSLRPVG